MAASARQGGAGADVVLVRRVRLLVVCGMIAFFASTVFNIGFDLWASSLITAVLFVVTAVGLLGYDKLLRRVPPRAVAHVMLGACVLAIALIAFGEGTTRTPNLHFLSLVVVASALLLGVRASRIWTIASILAAAVTFGADVALRKVDPGVCANHGLWLALVLVVLHLLASAAWRVADASMAESERAAERARKAAAELESANAALATAMMARSQFLANMSHEIRTPLNAVLGFADVLQGTALDDDQRQYVETIRSAGRGLLVIIDDVLDLARIEAGKLGLTREPVDLGEMIAFSLDMLAVAAHKKGIELWAEIDPDAPTHVDSDPARVRQVLLNLVGNAVKFTTAGEVRVRLSWADDRVAGRIEVHDTGAGIAPSAFTHLFQPFGQEDGSTRRRHGGTGLGLVISKKLIDGMDGRIGFTSELGDGSVFWIELPAARRTPAPTSELSGVTVVVVEGRDEHTRNLCASLQPGVKSPLVRVPATVTAAEIEARAAGPVIVVIDWDPACPAPLALASSLAAAGEWLRGIVLLAPFGDPTVEKEGRLPKRVNVVHKPVRVPRLLTRLAEVLGGERRGSIQPPPESHFEHRVLLVEDNPVNQTIARLMLQSAGCTVQIVGDGKQAVAAATGGDFDLVLMDLHMPELDGFEASRAIREDERRQGRRRVPILALSASVLPEDQARCLEAGMNGHLAKPISQKALHDLLLSVPARAV